MNRRLSCLLVAHGAVAVFFAVVLACGGGGDDPSDVQSCPTLVLAETCPSSPPSWKTDVQPIVVKYCYGCHGPGGVEESTLNYSTYQGVVKNRVTIADQIRICPISVGNGMPPPDAGQQPTSAEREALYTWALTCSAPNN